MPPEQVFHPLEVKHGAALPQASADAHGAWRATNRAQLGALLHNETVDDTGIDWEREMVVLVGLCLADLGEPWRWEIRASAERIDFGFHYDAAVVARRSPGCVGDLVVLPQTNATLRVCGLASTRGVPRSGQPLCAHDAPPVAGAGASFHSRYVPSPMSLMEDRPVSLPAGCRPSYSQATMRLRTPLEVALYLRCPEGSAIPLPDDEHVVVIPLHVSDHRPIERVEVRMAGTTRTIAVQMGYACKGTAPADRVILGMVRIPATTVAVKTDILPSKRTQPCLAP